MNQIKKFNLRETDIKGKSDRLIVWKSKRFDFEEWKNKKRNFPNWQFLFQPETKPYDLETKRLQVYVNKPENKLKYVFELNKKPLRPGELPVNPNCHNEDCCEESRRFNQKKALKREREQKIYEYAYELTLIHQFKKGNTLLELQKYKHKDWPKKGYLYKSNRKPTSYVSSYPELVKDIITGKIS